MSVLAFFSQYPVHIECTEKMQDEKNLDSSDGLNGIVISGESINSYPTRKNLLNLAIVACLKIIVDTCQNAIQNVYLIIFKFNINQCNAIEALSSVPRFSLFVLHCICMCDYTFIATGLYLII